MSASGGPRARSRAIEGYRRVFGAEPTLVVRAPGRVNLIGEHTDYNDGFVLPMALPFDIVIAGEPRLDGRVVARSEGFDPIEFALADTGPQPGDWALYIHGTAAILTASGHPVAGWQGILASDIPAGASLSSSAALEIAAGLTFVTSAGASIDPRELALVGQRVENDVLGLPSGIMDQLASATAEAGSACLIDCRDLSLTPVPLPAGVDIVIMDTGTRRVLADSAYRDRRNDCEAAVVELAITSLRDATIDRVAAMADGRPQRRARHVVTENTRTLEAAGAMRRGDAVALGALMNASHTSLRDDYEVSSPALNAIVAIAQSTPGCLGARMTGGGFAGCAVAMVSTDATDRFVRAVTAAYVAPASQPSTERVRLYVVQPSTGAAVLCAPHST